MEHRAERKPFGEATMKLLFYVAVVGCLIALASAAQARTAYDGSWDLVFVTKRGGCDPTYNFSVNISNGICDASEPGEVQRSCGELWCRPRLSGCSRQIRRRLRQALEQFWSRHVERLFGQRALFGLLDCTTKLTFDEETGFRPLRGRASGL